MTRFALDNRQTTYVVLLVIFLAGVSAWQTLPRNEDPGFTVRTAAVMTYFPGASPERVEQLVTDKLEKVIQEIPELDAVRSESTTGTSVIYVDILERYTNMRPIWDNLRRKVEKAESGLPEGISGPFVNDEYGDVFGIIIPITGEGFTYRELKDVADEVRDELLRVDEVAKVEIKGVQDERIFVEFSNARLAEMGISPLQLQEMLASRNIIIPGGDIETEKERIVLEPSGNFETLEEVRRTVIAIPGSRRPVYLEDVVDIHRGYVDPPETMMRATGAPALALAVSMREGGDILRLGREVKAVIDRAKQQYPVGIEFDFIQFQPEAVKKKIDDFTSNLLQAILVVIVMMLLTLGLRTGLIVGALIPMAMILSFVVMSYLDIGLDQMSLAALIISLGLLVDNGIVMSESIMVQMAAGTPAVEAAIGSANELRIPLLIATLTTAAAFSPVYLAESAVGEYCAPIFMVVTITLLSSWFLSMTMTPLLCVSFLKVEAEPSRQSFDSRFYRTYRTLLIGMVRFPWLTVAVTIAIFAVSMLGFKEVPKIFLPANDRPTFLIELELPAGTKIERTEAVAVQVESFIRRELEVGESRTEGVINWGVFIGEGAPRFILPVNPEPPKPEYAMFVANATSRPLITDHLIPRLQKFCEENFPDLKATIRPLENGVPMWPPVRVRVSGRDTDVLFDLVDQVKAKLRSTPGTMLIDDDWGTRSKKLVVRINQARALRAGVSNEDIATSLQTFLSGLDTTEFREDDELIPVTLRSIGAQRQDIGKLESINVYSQLTGRSVPLQQVADIGVVWEPAKIMRRDRLRTVTVEAGVEPWKTASEVFAEIEPWLEEQAGAWSFGYFWEFGGEAETSGKANKAIQAKMPIAGLVIVLLLVAQFNSVTKPLIILMTIPLGLIGVVVGLLVTNSYFGFMTLLGILSLAGIVINNAIVLLDRIRIEIEENGLTPQQAVIESAQRRLRPILLTTVTTVAGLIPLWHGGGPMFEPLAIAIIFGLIFATALTLGIVPVLYSIFFRVSFRGFRYAAQGSSET